MNSAGPEKLFHPHRDIPFTLEHLRATSDIDEVDEEGQITESIHILYALEAIAHHIIHLSSLTCHLGV